MTSPAFSRTRLLAGLVLAMLLGGCAHSVGLTAKDRARTTSAPVIHVVSYDTPEPKINPAKARARFGVKVSLHDVPTPSEVKSKMKIDLTQEIANGVVHGLRANGKLNNLVFEKERQALPPVDAFDHYRDKYRKGMVLEVWVPKWSLTYLPVDWKTYSLILSAQTRLIDLADGRVVWSTGECGFGSTGDYKNRLVLTDLKAQPESFNAKLRIIVNQARDECARQVMRRYLVTGEKT